jgi:hypothetical protein
VILIAVMVLRTGKMIPGLGLAGNAYWLLEGEGDRRAEQLEGPPLDRGWPGEFLDPLPAEGHGLAVGGGQAVEQVAVFTDGQLAAVALCAVFSSRLL